MASRLDLQTKLEKILGSRNVYYQPPSSVTMNYPAIVYFRKSIDKVYANDSTYRTLTPYEVIYVRKNSESEIVDRLLELPYSSYDRNYTSDNLHHDVLTIYN